MSTHAIRPAGVRSWRTEVMLFAGAYIAYSLARGVATGSWETALNNAQLIVELQARLGIGVERAVQDSLIGLPVMWFLNRLYLIAQFAVLPAALIWVYRRRPDVYPRLRTTVLATWVLALPVYALFPTAPPRLAAIGIIDTVSAQTGFALDSPAVMAFYNPVAAVPSLHAGFAFAIGVGVAAASSRLWVKAVALSWGPAIALVVVATGNHFVLDVVVGIVAVLLGYVVALLLHRPGAAVDAGTSLRDALPEHAGRPAPRPLRLALVCPYDWSVPGGVRSHVLGLAEALRARGHRVDLLAAGAASAPQPGLTLMGTTRRVRINGSVARVCLGPGAVRRVARALARGGYDVVHLHEPLVPSVCLSALASRRATLVGTFHTYDARALPYRILGPALRWPLRRLAVRIAVSEPARECAARVLSGDVVVIPNGIGISPATAGGAVEATRAPGGGRIAFVGRNEPRKGLAVLLQAFALMPVGTHLDLIGVRPGDVDLADLEDGVAERIHAHGRIGDDDKRRILRAADVLCAPSLGGESFGVVLIEAMAEGLPVVASAIAGYREVLPPDWGRLVPPDDHAALATALTEVMDDPDLRQHLRARAAAAVRPFEWSNVAERVETEYLRAMSRARAGTHASRPSP